MNIHNVIDVWLNNSKNDNPKERAEMLKNIVEQFYEFSKINRPMGDGLDSKDGFERQGLAKILDTAINYYMDEVLPAYLALNKHIHIKEENTSLFLVAYIDELQNSEIHIEYMKKIMKENGYMFKDNIDGWTFRFKKQMPKSNNIDTYRQEEFMKIYNNFSYHKNKKPFFKKAYNFLELKIENE